MMNRPVRDHEILSAVFAKMDVPAMSIAAGVVGSLLLFLATATLLLQAVPQEYPVGPHLQRPGSVSPGLPVSWWVPFSAHFMGFLVGAVAGFAAAVYWNLTHYVALGVMLISSAELAD